MRTPEAAADSYYVRQLYGQQHGNTRYQEPGAVRYRGISWELAGDYAIAGSRPGLMGVCANRSAGLWTQTCVYPISKNFLDLD